MPLNPTDLFVVQRGGKLYKAPSSELKIEYGSDAVVHVGENPPINPEEGTLWWSTLEGNLFIWYDDGDSQQWVDASPAFVEIDYTRIEDYIDQSVQDNAVAQIVGGQDIRVTPTDGKGIVTIAYDRTFLTEDQDRQDQAHQALIDRLDALEQWIIADQDRQDDLIRDILDRLDDLEDIAAGINNIDGGYPNAEAIFDERDYDGGSGNASLQTEVINGGNARGYVG
jgi:hypothetical protein